MSSVSAGMARWWPTILAALVAGLTGITTDQNFITQHPTITVLIGSVLMVLANFTHSPAGPRATPDSIIKAAPNQ